MYRRHFFLFAGISAIVAVPIAGLWGYLYFDLFTGILVQAGNGGQPSVSNETLVAALAATLVALLLVPFNYAAVSYAVCESAQGRAVTAWGVLRGVTRRYFSIYGLAVVIFLMTVLFCLFPLWIWILVGWVAVVPVMFVEDTGFVAATSRSWRLVQGRWWRTFLIVVLVGVLVYVVQTALGAFVLAAQFLVQIILSSVVATWIFAGVSIVIGSFVNPIFQIAIVLIYFDLRVRREALDLFQLAQHVAAPQPAS